MELCFLMLIGNPSCLTRSMGKCQRCMYCRSFNNVGRSHVSSPSLTSFIHYYQHPLSPSTNSSLHKNNFPGLLSKSNHLTNFGLNSKEVLATPLPYFFHHSPSLSHTPPSKPILMLSSGSCRNTGDHVGALGHPVGAFGHPVGRPVVPCFEADLRKIHLEI